jgi:hypothetical protein
VGAGVLAFIAACQVAPANWNTPAAPAAKRQQCNDRVRLDIASSEGSKAAARGSTKKRKTEEGLTRVSSVVRGTHLQDGNTVAAIFSGETLTREGERHRHGRDCCMNRQADGSPCCSGLYWNVEDVQQLMKRNVDTPQEERTKDVFNNMRLDGKHIRYELRDAQGILRSVCREVFLLHFQVSGSTLDRMVRRSKDGSKCAHVKNEEGGQGARSPRSYKTDDIVAWYDGYSKSAGDYMPDAQMQVVPRRFRCEEYDEYKVTVEADQCCSYKHFCDVLRNHEDLNHISRARKLNNFQVRVRVRRGLG